jgi:hypothetical protein
MFNALCRTIFVLKLIWASPWTLFGLLIGLAGLLTGGSAHRVDRILEFHGGLITWGLGRMPISGGAAALTLGHVVIGRDLDSLERCREHELVHVAQYERWGPFFIPAYFLSSAYEWFRGRDPYRDNMFEREAYTKAP